MKYVWFQRVANRFLNFLPELADQAGGSQLRLSVIQQYPQQNVVVDPGGD